MCVGEESIIWSEIKCELHLIPSFVIDKIKQLQKVSITVSEKSVQLVFPQGFLDIRRSNDACKYRNLLRQIAKVSGNVLYLEKILKVVEPGLMPM